MNISNKPIGVFDSGLGGLTVLKELKKILPNENYIYLGDLKNSPYGDKSGDEITSFTKKNIEFFLKNGVKLVVVACNTASSYNIESIREIYNVPIITVLESAISGIDKDDKNILLAATKATCNSGYFDKLLKMNFENVNLYKEACIDIVPSIENKNLNDEEIQSIVDKYIKKYSEEKINKLILGCTHYPIWKKYFNNSVYKEVEVFDPAQKLALEVYNYLNINRMLNNEKKSKSKFYVTKNKDMFFEKSKNFIGKTFIQKVEEIEI
ncbi:glutamate racemase [Helcococcus bovis]|uniref:glutamate racemase n=1 Tax=Helcococcus bovis TaxID=3153252 RepID=UPI0038B7CD99